MSQINTLALEQVKDWLYARPCTKLPIPVRISFTIKMLTEARYHIKVNCVKTLEELKMIAYDEKAEDDKPKLVKQDDHTWDADMYALTPYMRNFLN